MEVRDPGLLASSLTDRTATFAAMHGRPPVSQQELRERREAELRRGRAERLEELQRQDDLEREQAAQRNKLRLERQEQREAQRLLATQEQLARGNETVVRDVEATLAISAAERQLRTERLFIDWEMNVFLPIQKHIEDDVARDQARPVPPAELRRRCFQEYLDADRRGATGLDAVSTNTYDPFRYTSLTRHRGSLALDDPMDRPARIQAEEDALYQALGGPAPAADSCAPRDIPVEKFDRLGDAYVGVGQFRPGMRVIRPPGGGIETLRWDDSGAGQGAGARGGKAVKPAGSAGPAKPAGTAGQSAPGPRPQAPRDHRSLQQAGANNTSAGAARGGGPEAASGAPGAPGAPAGPAGASGGEA